MRPKLLLPLATGLLTACFPGDDWDTEHQTGRYYVLGAGPNLGETEWHNAQLYFKDEQYGYAEPLIRPNISAVRYNDQYIVAQTSTLVVKHRQQHIEHQYYIVPVLEKVDHFQAQQAIRGPLDRTACYQELLRRNGDTLLPETRRFFTP